MHQSRLWHASRSVENEEDGDIFAVIETLEKFWCDQKILRKLCTARRIDEAIKRQSLLLLVHSLINFVHDAKRAYAVESCMAIK